VTENNRLTRAPVFEINLRSVFGCNGTHKLFLVGRFFRLIMNLIQHSIAQLLHPVLLHGKHNNATPWQSTICARRTNSLNAPELRRFVLSDFPITAPQ
jgi:hypothetical protein